jgi:two-component system cell cycle response regulator DivK
MNATPLVLLVDDYDDAREMYEEYLMFRGYRVLTAASGAEALRVAQAERPALILMDLAMVDMSGAQALHALRNLPELAAVPVIAFTAHAMDRERDEALLDGFSAIVTKPCLPDELVAVIETYVAGNPDPLA